MENGFTKEDLEDWMVVEYRNGDRRIVNVTHGVLVGEDGNYPLDKLDYNLLSKSRGYESGLDVMEVFKPKNYNRILSCYFLDNNLQPIWKREGKSEEQIELESIRKEMEELSRRAKELEGKL